MLTIYEKLDKFFLSFEMLILKCYEKSINLFWLKQWMHLRINKIRVLYIEKYSYGT